MSRSLWKPLYNKKNFIEVEKNSIFKVWERNLPISKFFLKKTVKIHNGIRFFDIIVLEKMLGYKFGEFAPTRKFPLHKKKKKK